MIPSDPALSSCVAFEDHALLASGTLVEVTAAVRRRIAEAEPGGGPGVLLVFDMESGRVVDIDPRSVPMDDEPQPERARPRGRPKLGVVAREVTLLPRHWEWLGAQAGGASVALRRLVDAARRSDGGEADRRAAQAAAYRFMTTMAGDLACYEDATRALFAGDHPRFMELTEAWPADVREAARKMAQRAFATADPKGS